MSPLQRKVRTARIAGALYLGLAVSGALGFLITRPQLLSLEPGGTLDNLIADPGLARVAVVLELLTVLTQSLAAAWFYRLFHSADRFAAAGIAAFGLINAAAVLISAALLGAAAQLATLPVDSATATTVQALYLGGSHLWTVGGVFFGLWLIPMGLAVLRSGWMPRPLGHLLIAGGIGYVLSAFLGYLLQGGAGWIVDVLVVPATAGEFWMIGYLLFRGVRRTATSAGEERGSAERVPMVSSMPSD